MKIKKATVEDGEVLAGLAQLLWDGHDLKELTADFVKQLNDKGSACFLAYEAEAPAGFAQMCIRDSRRGGHTGRGCRRLVLGASVERFLVLLIMEAGNRQRRMRHGARGAV